MATNKNYSKIDTQFESIEMAPAPSPGEQPGGNTNPGVQPALNTPADVGVVDYRNLYYTPRGPAPSIVGKSVMERLDSQFQDQKQMAINWAPGESDSRPHGTDALESTMTNPLGMSIAPVNVKDMPATPPGDADNYGGGQGPGGGATPPGPTMDYGGGQ